MVVAAKGDGTADFIKEPDNDEDWKMFQVVQHDDPWCDRQDARPDSLRPTLVESRFRPRAFDLVAAAATV